MKIIHTSDIHLDSPLTSRLTEGKVKERRRELLLGFRRLFQSAAKLGAEAIIIAGDLFDSGKISKRALDTALDIIESNPHISVYYLPGNHEGDALSESGRALPKNLMIFGKDWTYYTLGNVTIAGRSEIKANMFASLDLPEVSGGNIVVLHGELREKTASPESIGLADAAEKRIDYMALGHYHSYSKTAIDDRAIAVYSGTPEGRGFDEAGDKGFVVIDADGRRLRHSFVKLAGRQLHIIPLDLTGILRTTDIAERARRDLSAIPYSDLVRLELTGKYSPELWKDTEGLKKEFYDRFYYFEIKDSSRPAINPDDYKFDKSLKGEFIRTVNEDKTLDEVTKEKIIMCGINALMGEELFEA